MKDRLILDSEQLEVMIGRLCMQLIENHGSFADTVLLGMQPRGSHAARRIAARLEAISGIAVPLGFLDATFFRDDFRRRPLPLQPNVTEVPFPIENQRVVLIDDVLFTGRSTRAALDAMIGFGRPALVELLVLADRRYSRELPVQADYVGITVDSVQGQQVVVEWKEKGFAEDAVRLFS
ncbi:MAG: bifunctional pyr operon transcriptional regulator/uracil phosphoribosyltransferase PyrR [Bacteroidota bacterium]